MCTDATEIMEIMLCYVSQNSASFETFKQETPTFFDFIYGLGLTLSPFRKSPLKVAFFYAFPY